MSSHVSVCIPVFNGGEFVEETIRSILSQTFGEFELVVVDNCSTDDTVERIDSIEDERLRLDRASEHTDAIANFVRATAACTGKYIKLVCADDTLMPTCLELQLNALEAHPSAVLAAGRRRIVDDRGVAVLKSHGLGSMRGLIDGSDAIARCVRSGTNLLGEPAAVMLRADALAAAGTWSDEWPYMTDLDLWFRLLRHGDLVTIPETVSTFRIHEHSWSSQVAETQARQARQLFRREAALPESAIGKLDLWLGSVRASLLKRARRVLYAMRSRRSRRPDVTTTRKA